MSALYNEIDPFAARWLRNLIAAGQVAPGAVDERSIAELAPADVAGPGQRHFFAGIAGWSLALRLADVHDDANIWTGSCPCQSLSDAGKRLGFADDRHLWPVWFRLIRECRPAVVFGEQVASSLGLEWLDLVFADLEGAGYACAAADLCAAGAGAPHRRQRLFFVAHADEVRHSKEVGRRARRTGEARVRARQSCGPGAVVELGDASSARARRNAEAGCRAEASSSRTRVASRPVGDCTVTPGAADWSTCDWIPCSDGVSRPVEPGTHPLAHGVPGRVGLLRGYGNAIVPQVAAVFIRSALEAMP